jgi:hypothetical protein
MNQLLNFVEKNRIQFGYEVYLRLLFVLKEKLEMFVWGEEMSKTEREKRLGRKMIK